MLTSYRNELMLFVPYAQDLSLPAYTAAGSPITFGVEVEGTRGPYEAIQNCARLFTAVARELSARIHKNPHTPRWCIAKDTSIERSLDDDQVQLEVISGILNGTPGIATVKNCFDTLAQEGFETNKSCGLHVHVSLGWPADSLSPEQLQQVKNILRAYQRNRDFFHGFIPQERWKQAQAIGQQPSLTDQQWKNISSLKQLMHYFPDRKIELNPRSLEKHGTLEWRIKPADGFVDALGYIQLVVLFTTEAAHNPNVMAEDVIKKHGLSIRNSGTKAEKLRRLELVS